MTTHSKTYSECQILAGVPRIGMDIHLCPFPAALDAYLEYVGNPQDYDYLMGISGAAFRRLWNRDDCGNVDLSRLGDEPFQRAFDALAYAWRKVPADQEVMIQAIKASLAQGHPVISFGIIGPPEAGLVTGYAKDGAVLYGWSYFQDQGERYYEQCDWFKTMTASAGAGLLIVGDRLPARPAAHEVLVASLEWALDLARTAHRPDLPEHLSGLAAYDGWADALEIDADYPPEDCGTMGTRVEVHGDQCKMVVERHEAARFLRRMKGVAPQVAEHLESAAALYDQIGDLVAPLWPWPIDPGAGAMQALADARTRRELAGHVRAARAIEIQAVEHLEQALCVLGAP
ncbi:MAG: hypothetical protein JW934_12260 [Anaerolineae bacterium]|nr:hypothetical protein [Anaerolineae bacterium]